MLVCCFLPSVFLSISVTYCDTPDVGYANKSADVVAYNETVLYDCITGYEPEVRVFMSETGGDNFAKVEIMESVCEENYTIHHIPADCKSKYPHIL